MSFSGLSLSSRIRKVNVAAVFVVEFDEGVGVGVGVAVGVGVGVGAGVAAGAGVTVICIVFCELIYAPVFEALAVMVHNVVWEKLAAVKFVW